MSKEPLRRQVKRNGVLEGKEDRMKCQARFYGKHPHFSGDGISMVELCAKEDTGVPSNELGFPL